MSTSEEFVKRCKGMLNVLVTHKADEPDPIQTYENVLELLQEILDGKDSSAIPNKVYFAKEFTSKLFMELLHWRKKISDKSVDLICQILRKYIELFLKFLDEDIFEFNENITKIFEYGPNFYQTYKLLNTEEYPECFDDWRKDLDVGSRVDAVKLDPEFQRKAWAYGTVVEVDGDELRIHFDADIEKCDRFLPRNSAYVQPFESHKEHIQWRFEIQENDLLDCYDTASDWYNCTITGIRTTVIETGEEATEVKIAYRVYQEDGGKSDEIGNFRGWSKKYDEWLNVHDPRIQKYDSMAKRYVANSKCEEYLVDDSQDLLGLDDPESFAVPRDAKCASRAYLDLIDFMGSQGGYDRIIEKIQDRETWVSMNILYTLLRVLAGPSPMYRKQFIEDYSRRIQDTLVDYFQNAPDDVLRGFSKEHLDLILIASAHLLKRGTKLTQRNECLDNLHLTVAYKCFKSPFLNRRIQGIKAISEVVKQIKANSSRTFTSEWMLKWVRDNKIVEEVFGENHHIQIIPRSPEILKWMSAQGVLTTEDLEMIWSLGLEGDETTKDAIYGVIKDLSLSMKGTQLSKVVSLIDAIPTEEITVDDINVLYEVGKYSMRGGDYALSCSELLWRIAVEPSGHVDSVKEQALTRFTDVMKNMDLKDKRKTYLTKCLEYVKEEKSVYQCIRIFQKLVNNFPASSGTSTSDFNRGSAIESMEKEMDLLGVFFKNFDCYLKAFREKVTQVPESDEDDLEGLIICDETIHDMQISERFNFLQFCLGNSRLVLPLVDLEYLWDNFIVQKTTDSDAQMMLKWLKEAIDATEQKNKPYFETADIQTFFNEKMSNEDVDFQSFTIEGYNCFQSLFVMVNKEAELLRVDRRTSGVTSISNTSYGNSSSRVEYEYYLNDCPKKLKGFSSITSIILDVRDFKVAEKALEFLNKLLQNIPEQPEEGQSELLTLGKIREEYIEDNVDRLQKFTSQYDDWVQQGLTEGDAKMVSLQQKLKRSMTLLSSILEESEKKGIAGLKSHSAMLKGEKMTINIQSTITSNIQNTPKKLEIELYSSTTIWDLRTTIAKAVKTVSDQVKILKDVREIKDGDNGKTIGELRIRNGDTLIVSKQSNTNIPKAPLFMPDGELNPKVAKIFLTWFHKFAKEGKMNPEGCAAFIHSCINDGCKADDDRVKETFAKFDSDKDGFLDENDFLEFYKRACEARSHVVWSNLNSHNYRADLKREDEVEEEEVDKTILPRYILTNNQRNFEMLFKILDIGGNLASQAWSLISRLPTNPMLFNKLLSLEDISNGTSTFGDLLDTNSNYRLLYLLQIMEFLMEDQVSEEEVANKEVSDNNEGEQEDEKKEENLEEDTETDAEADIVPGPIGPGKKDASKEKKKGPELVKLKIHERSNNDLFSSDDNRLLKTKWPTTFLRHGGFKQIYKILNQFDLENLGVSQSSSGDANLFAKNCLSYVLKIMRVFLLAGFRTQEPSIYDVISLVRRSSSADETVLKAFSDKTGGKSVSTDSDSKKKAETLKREDSKTDEPTLTTQDSVFVIAKDDVLKDYENIIVQMQANSDLTQGIIEQVDFESLQSRILTFISKTLSNSSIEIEDRNIVIYALNLWVGTVLHSKTLVTKFCNNQVQDINSKAFIRCGLLYPRNLVIRKEFIHSLYQISVHIGTFEGINLPSFFFDALIEPLPEPEDDKTRECSQYFALLCKLAEKLLEDKTTQHGRFTALFQQLLDSLDRHPFLEKRNYSLTDQILVGKLTLVEKLVHSMPELKKDPSTKPLIQKLFNEYLFSTFENEEVGDLDETNADKFSSQGPPKCKSRESRSALYKLLGTLTEDSAENLNQLLMNCVIPLTNRVTPSTAWKYLPSLDTRSFHGYSGIKNLGCICYMNAMHQQFFTIPTFRYGILAAADGIEPTCEADKKGEVDENVLHQLQKMYAHLELSELKAYDPYSFCYAFKDFDGNPTPIMVQQDAQEFLNMLFDRLENALNKTAYKYLLQGVFGGKTCNQIICQGCGFVRERQEDFYNLSLGLKGCKNVYESLEKFITADQISDFKCDNCEKTVNVEKRTCLEELPNVLIIHLQRIVFNYDTFMNEKVNSRLEFPQKLSLEPYTKEGLAWREYQEKEGKKEKSSGSDEEESEKEVATAIPMNPLETHDEDYYEYKLAGICVHTGTANAGHYYSFINVNRTDESKPDHWLEFNDSTIRSFNPNNIESECFGGSDAAESDTWNVWTMKPNDHSKSAYMLVYERALKTDLKLMKSDSETTKDNLACDDTASPSIIDSNPQNGEEPKSKEVVDSVSYDSIRQFIPARYLKLVNDQNNSFLFDRQIYHVDFFNFVAKLLSTVKKPESEDDEVEMNHYKQLVQIGMKYIFTIMPRAHSNLIMNNLEVVTKHMTELLSSTTQTSHELIEQLLGPYFSDFTACLLSCNDSKIRKDIAGFVSACLQTLAKAEEDDLLEEITITEKVKKTEKGKETNEEVEREVSVPKALSGRFVLKMLEIVPTECPKQWIRFQQYFEILRDFVRLGRNQLEFMHKNSALVRLVDFVLGNKSPLLQSGDKRYEMGSRLTRVDGFDSIVEIVSLLIRNSKTPQINGEDTSHSSVVYPEKMHELTSIEKKLIEHPEFYIRALKGNHDTEGLGRAIGHLAYKNRSLSLTMANCIMKIMDDIEEPDEIEHYFNVIRHFFDVEDDHQTMRFDTVFGYAMPACYKRLDMPYPFFGIGQISSVTSNVMNYESLFSADGAPSLLHGLWQQRNRYEYFCITYIKYIFALAEQNIALHDYLTWVPSPTYRNARYTDWIGKYLNSYIEEQQRLANSPYMFNQKRQNVAQEALKYYNIYQEKLEAQIDSIERHESEAESESTRAETAETEETKQPQEESEAVEREIPIGPFTPYVFGQTVEETPYAEVQAGELVLKLAEYKTYILESRPTGEKNKALTPGVIGAHTILGKRFLQKNAEQADKQKQDVQTVEDTDQNREENSSSSPKDKSEVLKEWEKRVEEDGVIVVPAMKHSATGDNDGKPSTSEADDTSGATGGTTTTAGTEKQETGTTTAAEEESIQVDPAPKARTPVVTIHDPDSRALVLVGDTEETKDYDFENGKTACCIIRCMVQNPESSRQTIFLSVWSEDKTPNFRFPRGPIKANIGARSTSNVISLFKINPEQPWGDIQYKIEPEQEEPKEEIVVGTYPANDSSNVQGRTYDVPDEVADDPGVNVCSSCTLINDPGAVVCEACDSPFLSRL